MVKRMVAAATVALGVLAAPAAAQQYPPAQNSLTVSDTTPTPGQTVTITVQTCAPGSSVTVTLDSDQVVLGTTAADSTGVARLTATIPANTSLGAHTIIAVCTGSDGVPLRLTAAINVVSAGGSGSGAAGALPRTGDDTSLPLARIGLALAAAGGVVTAIAAKRRKAAAAA